MSKGICESEAREKIAAAINASKEEIYFTSGRADGHLKALKAAVKASKKARPHVIITTMEDPEVLDDRLRADSEDIPTDGAEGRICAEIRSACPPGVALIVSGERIDENCIKILKRYSIFHVNVVK